MKKIGTVTAASIAAFAVGATVAGGIAIASADTDDTDSTTSMQQRGWGQGSGDMMGQRGPGGMMGQRGPGELVTGEDAQKAIDAALAAVPGTADHVHKVADGTYRVMVQKEDGTRVVVTLDADFVVTGQQEMTGRGPRTPATEEQTQKATDAALARVPGATVLHVFVRDDGGFAVLVRKDNGRKRVVLLDENYGVESVENPGKDRRHGPRGHHGRMGTDVVGPKFKKAEAAALQEVPDGTVLGVHKVGKRYMAAVRTAEDSMVLVKMNRDFKVTGTQEMDFRRGHGPDMSAGSSTAA